MDIAIFIKTFFLPLSVATVVAYIASPIVIALYRQFGWVDDPEKNPHPKVTHTRSVPRGGGIVIFIALLAGVLVFLGINKYSLSLLSGALILAIVGIIDDVKNINPYARLLVGVAAALMVVLSGIGIAFITNPLGDGVIYLNQPQIPVYIFGQLHTIWIIADLFAVLWILWCMNMINWSKGLDGQLPGQVIIASLVIALLSLRFTEDITQWSVVILASITAGAYLGFLPWNFFPQKMMPGYGAGSIAGYLLAILSILSGAKVATLIIVLIIPMMDAVYVIMGRLSRGQSPVWGDRSHFHHRLLDLGWSKSKVALFYWGLTLIMGIVALQLNSRQKAFTILLIALVFGAIVLWFNNFISSSKQSDPDSG
jgi:UDP-GlcNAc:undecaprenyl-phosphate GlcNAc-1-phosphate transferase